MLALKMTIGDRIKHEREKRGISQRKLARDSGMAQQSLMKIEKGLIKRPKRLKQIADALGVEFLFLEHGGDLYNITTKLHIKRSVPLVSWVSAGKWCCSHDNSLLSETMEEVPCVINVSKDSFALRVEGDSMISSEGISFSAGTILIVDPNEPYKNGSYVIATTRDNETTFKQLMIDGGKKFLKPLNTRYPVIEMTEEMNICAVVVASQNIFK